MKRFSAILIVLVLGMLLLVPFAGAQDITRGSIGGVVRDPSGAVVANATVTLKSSYGDRKTSTGANGEYAFANLIVAPGYEITVEKAGFSTAKVSELTVSLNQRATADVSLQVGATSTMVDVTASATATIDMQSTSVGANIGESLYKNVPAGRNISSIIQFAPGVADSAGAGAANPSINGASGLENTYSIDGADVTDPGFGGFGTYSRTFGPLGNGVNFDFVKEVQVMSGGFEAQYGQALGGVINVLTKSGSNAFHGSLYGYFQPQAFEASRPNPNDLYVSKVTYRTHQANFDFGGDIGGYFKKDKFFFYGGVNPTLGHVYDQADPLFVNSSLGVQDGKTTTYNYVGKLNYQITSRHAVEGEVFGDPASTNDFFWNGINTLRTTVTTKPDYSTTSSLEYGSRTWSTRYTGTLSSKWILTASYSSHYNSFVQNPLFSGYRITDNTPVQEKTGTGALAYGGVGFYENFDSSSKQVGITSSHIFSLWGNHSLDYGFQFQDQPYNDFRVNSGGDFTLPNLPIFKTAAGAIQHGAALTRTHQVASDPTSPIVYKVTRGETSDPTVAVGSKYTSAFIQDSWTIGRHLTVKPGLRFEQQSMFGTFSRYVFAHNWAPRIGVIFDPTGDRKSKVLFNWGRFYEKIPSDISVRAFSFETSVLNALYKDAGAGNQPNLSASNYVGGTPSFSGTPDDATLVYGGTAAQYQDEYIAGYEKEFSHGFTFSGHFVYRDLKRIIEDTSGINVTQYNAGVAQQYVIANPNSSLDIFTNAFACTGGPPKCDPSTGFTPVVNPLGKDGVVDGFPDPKRTYKSMELIVSRRFANGFQLYANYTLSSLEGNFQGSFRSDNSQTDPNISSLFDFTNTDNALGDQYKIGDLPSDRRHQIKVFGNYAWKGLNLGVSWRILSGTPISKLLDHPGYLNAGEIPVGGRGSLGRSNVQFPLDVHLDYAWKWKERTTVKFLADLFNVGNQVTAVNFNQFAEVSGSPGTANPDFLKPASTLNTGRDAYTVPFRARLGIRFEF